MSEWTSRPRTTPMAGRRKPTLRFCLKCAVFHNTHRSISPELCKQPDVKPVIDFPTIRLMPRTASK